MMKRKVHIQRIHIQSEQGSALVLVMFIILLLTILGISVMGAAVGGATLTETRESDVQSLHLAQKSIDEALAYITAELNNTIENSSSMTQGEIDQYIDTFLTGLNANKASFVTGTLLPGATNEITEFHVDTNAPSGEQSVTIKANATVNGVLRTLQQTIKITTFPDFLNYSLGSEGIVYLNGAPSVSGNIYAGEELKVSTVANYIHNANLTKLSKFPFIEGEVHVQSIQKLLYSENGTVYRPTTEVPSGSSLDERVQKINESVKIKKNSTFVQIDVEDSFLDKVAEAASSLENKPAYINTYYGPSGKASNESATVRGNRLITSLKEPSGPIRTLEMPSLENIEIPEKTEPTGTDTAQNLLTDEEIKQQIYEEKLQKLKLDLGNLTSSRIFKGDLTVNGVDFDKIINPNKATNVTKDSSWFIVNGDLTLDNYSTQPITVQSNILVTGDLFIKGDVTFDSTMFVLGQTEIVNAAITGIGGKELVLISKGSILINRVEEFKAEATTLRAFFYTDSTAHLYGVGSIFSLDGGFFAKGDLTINAVLGNVSQKEGQAEFEFDAQLIETAKPRFTVSYNKNVFEHQFVGLPRINQINIQVGPIELLQPGS